MAMVDRYAINPNRGHSSYSRAAVASSHTRIKSLGIKATSMSKGKDILLYWPDQYIASTQKGGYNETSMPTPHHWMQEGHRLNPSLRSDHLRTQAPQAGLRATKPRLS